mmetsp:Transcript_29141/g.66255  ORF Transcript_29141/g.66255 Transcript_29141/m.66255 type:complete len:378 (+) Transcript_29141:60-1193(+)
MSEVTQRKKPAAKEIDDLCCGDAGMLAPETTLDWSARPNSERKDRVLPAEVVSRLSAKSDWKGLRQLGIHLVVTALGAVATWACLHGGVLGYLALPVVVTWQGFVLCSLGFAGQHECVHFTAFRSRWLNRTVGFWASVPSFTFAEHELLLHKDHHTFTGDPKRDTELLEMGDQVLKPGFRKIPDSPHAYWWSFVETVLGKPSNKMLKLINCARGIPVDYTGTGWNIPRDVNSGVPSIKSRLQKWGQIQLAFYAVVVPLWLRYFGFWTMIWYWLLPVFVGPAPLWYLQIAEHADCTLDSNGLTNTRSVTSSWLVRLVYWNMNLHAEHHLYPTFPFHALPEAHELLRGHLKKVHSTYPQLNTDVLHKFIPAQMAGLPVA